MTNGDEYSTKIGWREKIRLLLSGAGTIVGIPADSMSRREVVIGKTTRADLSSESDIVIQSGGGSLFSEVDPLALDEMREWIDQEIKGSGTSKR